MKFTELADYPIPGGIVTEWTPTTVGDPSGWTDDPRPLSPDHEASCREWRQRNSSGSTEPNWLGGVFEIADRYQPEMMRQTLRKWIARHDAFLTTAVDGAAPHRAQPIRRRTYRGTALDVVGEVLGHIDDGHTLAAHLTSVFDNTLSPLDWPHCRVATITPLSPVDDDSGFLVVFAADHVALDAYSILLAVNEIQTLYAAEVGGYEAGLPPTGSHIDFSVSATEWAAAIGPGHPSVDAWRGLLDPTLAGSPAPDLPTRFPEFGIPLRRPRLESADEMVATQRGYSEFIADADQSDLLDRHCRAAGFSTQTAVLAAIAIAHREVTHAPTLRLTMPWHTRHQPELVESIGWYVGLGPLTLDLGSAQTLADVLHLTRDQLRVARVHSRHPHRRILELLDTHDSPKFVASYLDVRAVPGAAHWPQRRVQTIRGASRSDSEVYLWIARVPTGMTLSCRHPDSELASEIISRFIATTVAVLRVLWTAGVDLPLSAYLDPTLTPADTSRPA